MVGDVLRSAMVGPKAPGFIALLWKCGGCSEEGKLALELNIWEELEANYDLDGRLQENLVLGFAEDINYFVDGPDDLVKMWNSYGNISVPIEVEEHRGCGCSDCRMRRYGHAI